MTETTDYSLRSQTAMVAIANQPASWQRLRETFWTLLAGLLTLIALLPLFLVIGYVIYRGFERLDLEAFVSLPPTPLGEGGGFANALIGTVIMVAIGAMFSVPFGVLAAIYVTEFAKNTTARWIRFATNVLSGVPSILMGVFVYGIFVLTTQSFSAIAGGFALGVLMLPIIVRATDEALQLVPQTIRWAGLGMGASQFQTTVRVILPAALPAIATGVTLAVARAAGETAPLIFTALFAQYWSRGLWEPTASLAVLIYNFAAVPYEGQQKLAWAASLILVLIVLLTSIIARMVARRRLY
jgi:phosphate transport system permease protein